MEQKCETRADVEVDISVTSTVRMLRRWAFEIEAPPPTDSPVCTKNRSVCGYEPIRGQWFVVRGARWWLCECGLSCAVERISHGRRAGQLSAPPVPPPRDRGALFPRQAPLFLAARQLRKGTEQRLGDKQAGPAGAKPSQHQHSSTRKAAIIPELFAPKFRGGQWRFGVQWVNWGLRGFRFPQSGPGPWNTPELYVNLKAAEMGSKGLDLAMPRPCLSEVLRAGIVANSATNSASQGHCLGPDDRRGSFGCRPPSFGGGWWSGDGSCCVCAAGQPGNVTDRGWAWDPPDWAQPQVPGEGEGVADPVAGVFYPTAVARPRSRIFAFILLPRVSTAVARYCVSSTPRSLQSVTAADSVSLDRFGLPDTRTCFGISDVSKRPQH